MENNSLKWFAYNTILVLPVVTFTSPVFVLSQALTALSCDLFSQSSIDPLETSDFAFFKDLMDECCDAQ